MELSDSQFERLVTMLADNRVAVHSVKAELSVEIQRVKKDLSKQIGFLAAQVEAVEEDLGKVQTGLRRQQEILAQMDQSLVGVTQLCKTNFDMLESVHEHVLGESATLQHHGPGEPESRDRVEG